MCDVMGSLRMPVMLDSGADVSLISKELLEELLPVDSERILPAGAEMMLQGIGGKPVRATRKARLDLHFDPPHGRLVVKNAECWISEEALPPTVSRLLLGRGLMARLGYNAQDLLATACLRTTWHALKTWKPQRCMKSTHTPPPKLRSQSRMKSSTC